MTIAFVEQTAVTVSTTAISLTNGTTTIATNSTKAIVQVQLDRTNMAAGDSYQLALLEEVRASGTQRSTILGTFTGAQSEPFIVPAVVVGNGWDFTLIKLGGTDRAFDWSIREVS